MKKKKLWIGLAALTAASLAIWAVCLIIGRNASQPEVHRPGASPSAVSKADNANPSGAVIGLMQALQSWDLGLAAQWMSEAPEGIFSDAYHKVLAPMLTRMEFEVGSEKITGDTACVDISVTAVDMGSALGGASADAASYLVTCMIEEVEADWGIFLTDYLSDMDAGELMRVRRDATVYLVRDSGGKWRLDTHNPDNAAFWGAVSGGLPDTVARLKTLVEQGV